MFSLTSTFTYYYYGQPTDMRKNFDGLCGIVCREFDRLPRQGEVFLFINKRGDRLKLLHWETGGFVLYYKRLEAGTFKRPRVDQGKHGCPISWAELVMMVQGVDARDITFRKRYQHGG